MSNLQQLDETLNYLNEESIIFRTEGQMEDKIEKLKDEYEDFKLISKDKVKGISGEECWKLTYRATEPR